MCKQGNAAWGQVAERAPQGLTTGFLTPRCCSQPLLTQKTPLSSRSPSVPPRGGSAPLPTLWCLPGSPSLSWVLAQTQPWPRFLRGAGDATTHCSGLGAGPCPPTCSLPSSPAAWLSRACRGTRRKSKRRRVRTTAPHARTMLLLLLLPLPGAACSWHGAARQSRAL